MVRLIVPISMAIDIGIHFLSSCLRMMEWNNESWGNCFELHVKGYIYTSHPPRRCLSVLNSLGPSSLTGKCPIYLPFNLLFQAKFTPLAYPFSYLLLDTKSPSLFLYPLRIGVIPLIILLIHRSLKIFWGLWMWTLLFSKLAMVIVWTHLFYFSHCSYVTTIQSLINIITFHIS